MRAFSSTHNPGMATVVWTGTVDGQVVRVVDAGALAPERLIIEVQAPADAMGARGWTRQDLITRSVFQGLLIGAGVVR